MIKLTIIVPTYNNEKTVLNSINSIKKQNNKNFEIIFVDDYSIDKTIKIIDENMDENINWKVIKKSTNTGVSETRNIGLKEANGEYIYFLDADDSVEENFIEENLKKLNQKIDMLIFNYDELYPNGEIKRNNYNFDYAFVPGKSIIKDFLEKKIFLTMGSAIYSKELLLGNNIFFDSKYHYGEDQKFILQSLYSSKLVLGENKIYFHYHRHNQSAMSKNNKRNLDVIYCLEDLKEFFFRDKNIEELLNTYILSCLIGVCTKIIKYNSLLESRRKIKEEIINCKDLSKYFIYSSALSFKYRVLYLLMSLNITLYILFVKIFIRRKI